MIIRKNTFSVSLFIGNFKENEQKLVDPPKHFLIQNHSMAENSGWSGSGTEPIVKGLGVVLKIEIQEAQENILVCEKGAHGGVPLHGRYPEPEGRGVVHAAVGRERGVSQLT